MTVRAVWTPAGRYEVEGVGYAPAGRVTRDGAPLHAPVEDVLDLARAGALCSDAVLRREEGSWRIDGDPTEGALVVAAAKVGFDVSAVREAWPRLDAIPFESERQYMATLHRDPEGRRVVLLKGAPEMVLKRCEGAHDGPTHEVELALERMARAGMRVLAVARRVVDEGTTALDEQLTERGFTLVGLAGMIDPPREEAMAAVADCRRAGIQVKMITGDHPETARAIGEQLGLGDGPAMTGHELARLDEAGLRRAVRDTNVFARVAPEHKLQLVRALQQEGHVVAMTGDGVNDAPALKQADIGVAMGITGTAVSREAADVVLADDNFASIAAAVEEGRRVYDNLIKALAFVLPTNLGEALIILLAVMFFPIVGGEPLLPMLPVQILWINLVATVALALPLAFEALEPNVMRRPPRDPKTPILSRFVLARTGIVALLMTAGAIGLFLYEYYGEVARGVEPALALREAQTMAVTTVVLMQVFYLLNCRSLAGSVLEIGLFTNRMVFVGIAAILALQLAFVYLPPLNALFGSAPLGPGEWVKATLVAAIVLPVIGLEKRWRRSRTEAVR
jgi:Ca2+-transporting ATPase